MARRLENLGVEIPPRPHERELDAFWKTARDRLASSLARHVPAGSAVVYLDYPIHGNTGDQMIMLGTECWFRQSAFEVVGRWHVDNFRFPKLPGGAIIICQGGGNMGDLYRYQRHREAIVRAYPDHRIVFLPQTVYYRDPERLRQSARTLRQHDDLHLYVRERTSFELARAEFTTTTLTLAPDMAALLHPLPKTLNCELVPAAHSGEVLYLMRRDWEWTSVTPLPRRRIGAGVPDFLSLVNPFRGGGGPKSASRPEKARRIDWHETAPREMYLAWATLIAAFLFGRLLPAERFSRFWRRLARRIVIRGARSVLGCTCLVTNRLHAHLMACLLGVPNVLLDNSYGKCSAYFHTWQSGLPFTKFVDQGILKPGERFKGIGASQAKDIHHGVREHSPKAGGA